MTDPAQRPPSSSPTPRLLDGIDVSRHNGAIRWPLVAPRVSFVLTKLTDGVRYQHVQYGLDVLRDARIAGIPHVGAYHYLLGYYSGAAQARAFLEALGGDPVALPPRILAVDVEDASLLPGYAAAQVIDFCDAVREATGTPPWIYVSPNDARRLLLADASGLADSPLWLAHWNVAAPTVPAPWDGWVAWQRGKGAMPGIAGEVDLDRAWL